MSGLRDGWNRGRLGVDECVVVIVNATGCTATLVVNVVLPCVTGQGQLIRDVHTRLYALEK